MKPCPPKQRIFCTGNQQGSTLSQHGTRNIPPSAGVISKKDSGIIPGNCRGYPPRDFPPDIYCFVTMREGRDTNGGSIPSGGNPTRGLPILTVILMTTYTRCRAGQNANTESLIERFVISSISYPHYRDSPKTW